MNGTEMTISRQGPTCPGSCIQPMQVAPGVRTLGELEVIAFLQSTVEAGSGLLIDVRMPGTFMSGSLPGAVNVPVATFSTDNPYRDDLLSALGAETSGNTRSFSNAFTLLVFGEGADDRSATDAITGLLDAGYPENKILYYRGGTADWTRLGLNLSVGQ
ncbi:rhodanese-like domain-containing protein [Marivita hallyeonensis]|nr:rhodanese-like domain-containing protein [Marivita hallyeonensis]